jgi:hypothetical protein
MRKQSIRNSTQSKNNEKLWERIPKHPRLTQLNKDWGRIPKVSEPVSCFIIKLFNTLKIFCLNRHWMIWVVHIFVLLIGHVMKV